jgi:hypothetical protein
MAGHEKEAVEAVKLCVELGNDQRRNDVETPLHGAMFRGVNEIVEYLVSKGGPRRATARLDAVHDCQRHQLRRRLHDAADGEASSS